MKHLLTCLLFSSSLFAQQTQKPVLHGKHWMAVTGKPLAATAGSMIFQQGGNAVDAACAMLAATCTMWDVLSWGGETQALIYNPKTKKVIGIHFDTFGWIKIDHEAAKKAFVDKGVELILPTIGETIELS